MRRIKGVFLRNPFLSYAIVGAVLQSLVYAFDVQYDDRGARSLLFWAAQLFGLLSWVVNEVIFLAGGGRAIPLQLLIVIATSIVLGLAIDAVIRRARRHRHDRI
jgi:hypothetical protein